MDRKINSCDMDGALRIGFVADTHQESYGLIRRAVELMCEEQELDYLFHLGDFLYNFVKRPGEDPYKYYATAARRLDEIADEFKLKGIYIILGNHDVKHPEKGLCELERFSIHKKIVELAGYNVLGYGGGFNFFRMKGWEYFDDKRYKCSSDELVNLLEQNTIDILVLHQLESESKNVSLRKVIEPSKVKLVVSGHTHSHGVEFYAGKQMYVSCGPIWPLDEKTMYYKLMGKSSYCILELKQGIARARLYFFWRDFKKGVYVSELDAEMKINFDHY